MKEQGFTLIELLAVIVILAIIALIATPIVLNIISSTKENAQLRSAEMYLDAVEQSVALERMTNTTFNPNSCNINNGDLECEGYQDKIEVKVNGEKPNNGSITFTEGKITQVELKYENGKTITMNNKGDLEYNQETSEAEGSGSNAGEEGGAEVLAAGTYDADGNLLQSWDELEINVEENVNMPDAQALPDNAVKLVIPEGTSKIGCYKFANVVSTNKLKEIVLPNSVTYIGASSFLACDRLKTINYNGTKKQWNSINLDTDWNQGCPEITVHCTDGDIIIPAYL